MNDTIKPGIVITTYYGDKETIYPTGFEWLLAFAIRGCKWAQDALPEAISNYNRAEVEKTLGSGI